jgi:5'-deoxynucleotidase YfbR-like HD superfamily hydrolase
MSEQIKGPTIRLWSGHYFKFLDPDNSAYTIDDIAHGLSMVCRFGGHCAHHYSVAQHSVHVSEMVPPEFAYQGLMHDAPEALIGDVMKPLKMLLPDYQALEKKIEISVFKRLLVPYPLSAHVKDADWRMLITEQRQLARSRDDWATTQGREPYTFTIPQWSPEQAKAMFLARFAMVAPVRFAT